MAYFSDEHDTLLGAHFHGPYVDQLTRGKDEFRLIFSHHLPLQYHLGCFIVSSLARW